MYFINNYRVMKRHTGRRVKLFIKIVIINQIHKYLIDNYYFNE